MYLFLKLRNRIVRFYFILKKVSYILILKRNSARSLEFLMAYTDTVGQVRRACLQMRGQAAQDLPSTAHSHGQIKAAFARIAVPDALLCSKTVEIQNPVFIAGVLKTPSSLFSSHCELLRQAS